DTVFNVPVGTEAPDVAQLRATAEAVPGRLGGEPEAVASITDAFAPGEHELLPVRIYRPAAAELLPLVVYAHGGGWVTGSLDSQDRLWRILANRLRAVLVAVAGESSGGNLAAALTLRLRSDGAVQPNLQLLLYPALDATCSRPSYREFATGYNLSAGLMAWYWDAYRAGAAKSAVGLSPLAAADLSGLPPAVIAVAECDVLRDDGIDYAARLDAAGIAVRLIRCEGMIHGFLRWTGKVPAAHRWIDAIGDAGRAALGGAGT